jgi:hypothetical protein
MATFNWPGFGIKSVSWTLKQPSQSNTSGWTGKRTVVSNPWHGMWTAKVDLATRQGDGAFQTARGFFTGLLGSINTFHLPAVEAPQNANTGVTVATSAVSGATSLALTGITTALVAGNMITIAGQLLSIISVGSLSGSAQTVNFRPALRAAAASTTSVETAKPYALVFLSDDSFTWDIATWRLYGLSFSVQEAVSETDGASPSGDVWNATFSTGGGGGGGGGGAVSALIGVSDEGTSLSAAISQLNFTGAGVTATISGSQANIAIPGGGSASDYVNAVTDYGIVAGTGHGAANDTAILAMFADLRTKATNASTFYQGTIPIHFPAGYFEFSSTIDLTDGTFIIEGATSGMAGGWGTIFKFPAGVTGIRVQRYNTSGATGTRTGALGADGSIIRNIGLRGGYASTEASVYGIHLRARAQIENVYIENFEGDGIYSIATASGSPDGNANSVRIEQCRITNCRNGIFIDGADTNIWSVIGVDCSANRQWGFWDSSFLGNSYFACHADSNGLVPGTAPSVVSQSSNRYCVIFGQETGASTNAPSGTTADNTWWYYISAGAVSTGNNIPAWTSGTTYRSGGGYLAEGTGNANNCYSGCYHEGGQGMSQLAAPSFVAGGSMRPNVKGVAVLYGASGGYGNLGYINVSGGMQMAGNIQALGSQFDFGPTAGAAADLTVNFKSTNVNTVLQGQTSSGLSGSLGFYYGTGNIYDVSNSGWEHRFRINGTTVFRVNSGGLALKEIAAASVATPAAGEQALFIDTADHKLKRKDSSGTVTIIA